MANIFSTTFRKFPVTAWALVGVTAYVWKASLVSSMYQQEFAKWEEQRIKELNNVKM